MRRNIRLLCCVISIIKLKVCISAGSAHCSLNIERNASSSVCTVHIIRFYRR